MQSNSASARLFHLLARFTYLQDLLNGQRVLLLGHAEATTADALDKQGVRRAVFIDPSEERCARARGETRSRRVEFMVGPLERVALVEDSFDLALIEDFANLEDRGRVLAAAKRGLTPNGVLIAAIPNPDATMGLTSGHPASLGYYEFYGQLADSFPFVRMIGQCPLVGFALADLAVDDPEAQITFDSSLLEEGSEDAEFFMALCSRAPITSDPFAVVQIPLNWVDVGRLAGEQAREPSKRLERERPRGRRRESIEAPRDVADKVRREPAKRQDEVDEEIKRLKLELDKRAVTIAKLENHLREARERASTEHNRVVQTKIKLEAERKKVLALEKDHEMDRRLQRLPGSGEASRSTERSGVEELEAKLEEARREASEAQARLEKVEKQLAEAQEARKTAEARIKELESRSDRIDILTADLGRERGARKLAEAHAKELESKLKELRKASRGGAPPVSPVKAALAKAEAVFGGGANAQVEELKAELAREREARQAVESQLDAGAEAAMSKLRADLEAALNERDEAREQLTKLEGRLGKAEAKATHLESMGQARARAEAAFGGASREPVVPDDVETSVALKACLAEKEALERDLAAKNDALTLERELRQAAEARVSELEAAQGGPGGDTGQLERELEDTRRELERAEAERREALDELARVRRDHGDLEGEVDRLRGRLAEAREAARAPEVSKSEEATEAAGGVGGGDGDERVERLEAALAEEREKRRHAEEDLTALERAHGDEVAALERALRDRSAELRALEERALRADEMLKRALADLEKAERRGGDNEPDADALERALARIAELEADVEERDRGLAELMGELQGHKWRISELELRLDAGASSHLDALDTAIDSAATLEEGAGDGQADGDVPLLSLSGGRATTPAPPPAAWTDVSRLQIELARLQGKAEVLEAEHRRAREEADEARQELRECRRRAAELETSARAADEARTIAIRRADELRAALDQANTRAAAMERKAAETVGQLQATERELTACHRAHRELEAELGASRQNLGAQAARVRELEERCAELQREIAEVRRDAAASSKDLAAAQACMAMLEEQMPGVSSVLSEFRDEETAELPAYRDGVDLMRRQSFSQTGQKLRAGESADVARELAEARSELDRAKTREAVLQARVDELTEKAEQDQDRAAVLAVRVEELERELAEVRERSGRLAGELAQAHAAMSLSQSELAELREQADAAALELARLTAEHDQTLAQLERGRAELDDRAKLVEALRAELEALRHDQKRDEPLQRSGEAEPTRGLDGGDEPRALAGLERMVAAQRRALAQQEGRVVGLTFKLSELESELDRTSALLEKSEAARAAADERVRELEALVSTGDERIAQLEASLAAAEQRPASAPAELEELRAQLREAQRRAASLAYIGDRADEWSERLEEAGRVADELRIELEECRGARRATDELLRELEAARAEASKVDALLAELEAARAAQADAEALRDELRATRDELEALRAKGDVASADEDRAALEACRERIEVLESERRAAEDALERVIDRFSDAIGDAAALSEVLQDREDLIARLEARLDEVREQCVEVEDHEDAEGAADAPSAGGVEPSSSGDGAGPDDDPRLRDALAQLESARRVVAALEEDKRRLGDRILELTGGKEGDSSPER